MTGTNLLAMGLMIRRVDTHSPNKRLASWTGPWLTEYPWEIMYKKRNYEG